MAVQLRAGERPPFGVETPEEKLEKKADAEAFRIDTDGLPQRIFPLPVPAGNYFYLKAGKGKVLWASVEKFTEDEYEEIFNPRGATKWDLHIFDMTDKKEVVLGDKVREFDISTNGEHIIVRKEDEIHTISVDEAYKSKGLGVSVDLSTLVYRVDVQDEWNQIFNDCWRWYRDFFYDAGFHGRDWKAMGEKYRAYIPFLSSRDELNWVMSQMVGELCVSHTYISGGDYGPAAAPGPSYIPGCSAPT